MDKKLLLSFLLVLCASVVHPVQAQQCQLSPYSPSEVPEATSGFTRPVAETNVGYGFPQQTGNEYCSSRTWVYHPGRDINAATCCGNDPNSCDREKGTPVYAVATGRVVNVYLNGTSYSTIVIQHNYRGETWYSQYGHIQNPLVNCGEIVNKGTQIAQIGDNGTNCAHLHFEIREADHPAPTRGTYFCNYCGSILCLQNLDNVNNWYEDPYPFIDSHGPYSSMSGDFSVSVSPTTQSIYQGSTTSYTVTVQSIGGFSSPVTLSALNLPNNQALSGTGFSPNPVTPPANGFTTSTFRIATNTCTSTGAFQVTVRGTSGSLVRSKQVTLNVYAITGVTPVTWSFSTDGNREGWELFNWATWSVNSGKLFIDPAGADPYIRRSSLSIDARRYGYVIFSMASNALDSNGEIYFTTQADPSWNTAKRVPFTVQNCYLCGNAGFVTYFVKMCNNRSWTGTITGIRIDPATNGQSNTNKDSVAWDYIKVSP